MWCEHGLLVMEQLLNRYEKFYGYRPSVGELHTLYTSGEICLNAADENTLLQAVEQL